MTKQLRQRWTVPLAAAALLLFAGAGYADVGLPTPLSHYEDYDPNKEGLELFQRILAELDPELQKLVLNALQQKKILDRPPISKEQALVFIHSLNWQKHKGELLRLFIYHSQVLDMVPEENRKLWLPIVHDGMLYFFDHLSEDRLVDRLLSLAYMDPDSQRGDRILALAAQTPTFQKVGQILARNKIIPADIRASLQTLENSIQTVGHDQLIGHIRRDVGPEALKEYQVEFADKILAEASIGAVIRATLVEPGESHRKDAVCKVIKPYALRNLPEEIDILEGVAAYFEQNSEFYGIGNVPVASIVRDIGGALKDEIQLPQEQRNTRQARAYYEKNPKILVPEIYDLSNDHVTFMEFVRGTKISDAFPNDPERRAKMAVRLFNALTFDPLFAGGGESLFHGDPHAGNVFHVKDDPKDPFRIALLDWGIMGSFGRPQRMQLFHLSLAAKSNDMKRMKRNVGGLIEGGLPESPEEAARIEEILLQISQRTDDDASSFETLSELTAELITEGYKISYNLGLFIKSQVTIAGILRELDPNLDQTRFMEKRVRGRVGKEMPKRILLFPAWTYRGYRSMMSNNDVFRYAFQ